MHRRDSPLSSGCFRIARNIRMRTSGPRGKSLSDVVLSKGLFMSQDIIAADTAAVNFFNQVREISLEKVGFTLQDPPDYRNIFIQG